MVSDDEWLHEASTLLLLFGLSVLFERDALLLKDLGNLLYSGEINLTDLNCLKPSERPFGVIFVPLFAPNSFREKLDSKT